MATASHARTEVPFLDLGPSHEPIKRDILRDIEDLIDAGSFVNGPAVDTFEAAFAEYCGCGYSVGTSSGLDALRVALLALGIGSGDEVVVPAMTFVATFEAVTQVGARPVIADVASTDVTLAPEAAAAAVTARTRAIMPVHLYGQMADMVRLNDLAAARDIHLVEDACQAHGASRDGVRAGATGTAAAFSFYPAKNLGAFGDAGAATTNDPELARRMRALREHGQTAKYVHDVEGYTARLDAMQAVVLTRKLSLLDSWNEQRRAAASYYLEALRGIGDLRLPSIADRSDHVWHVFTIRTAEPDLLGQFLGQQGIGTGRHYPTPPHLTAAYAYLGHRQGEFPIAEAVGAETLSLPLFPGISEAQLDRVVAAVRDFFE